MTDKITQNRQILGHLRLHGTITPQEAMRKYGCFRLGARIYELKQLGHNISSELVKSRNCKHFSRYTLVAQ